MFWVAISSAKLIKKWSSVLNYEVKVQRLDNIHKAYRMFLTWLFFAGLDAKDYVSGISLAVYSTAKKDFGCEADSGGGGAASDDGGRWW